MIKGADTLYKAGDGRGNPSGRYSSCCNRTPVDGSAGVPEKVFPGMDYALTSNGARIVRTQDGSVLMEQLLSRDKAKRYWKSVRNMIPYKRYILMVRDMRRQKRCFMWNGIIIIRICGNI